MTMDETDENGYPMDAVLAWRRYGIYPPACGNPDNPRIRAMHVALLASEQADTDEEWLRHRQEAARLSEMTGASHNFLSAQARAQAAQARATRVLTT